MGITSDPQIPAKQAVCQMRAPEELCICYLVLIGVHLHPLSFPFESSLTCRSAQTAQAEMRAILIFLFFSLIQGDFNIVFLDNMFSRHVLYHTI